MDSMERTFQLHVPSSTENLAMIRDFVGSIGTRAGMSPGDLVKLELAVDEACANVIEHAYGSDDTREVNRQSEARFGSSAHRYCGHRPRI